MGLQPDPTKFTTGQQAAMKQSTQDQYNSMTVDQLNAQKNAIQGYLAANPGATVIPQSILNNTPGSIDHGDSSLLTSLLGVPLLDNINSALTSKAGPGVITPTASPTVAPTIAPNIAPPVSATPQPSVPGNPADNTSPLSPSLSATPSAPLTATSPQGGINGGADENQILAEAELQKQLSGQTLTSQNDANTKYLSDLSGLLQKQQAQSMSEQLPGVYEDLNTRGLLRSSALGNSLATEAKNLTAETSNQIANQGLNYQKQYTQGLGGIENSYESARNTALQRQFSLEDFQTQLAASKALGFALQPQQPQSSGKSPATAGIASAGISAAGNVAAAGK